MAEKKQWNISQDAEKGYLEKLREIGGDDLVKAGEQVIRDVRAGKAVKPPRSENKGGGKARGKAGGKEPVVGALPVPDPHIVARYGLCIATCLSRPNHIEKATCILFCLGVGVPKI